MGAFGDKFRTERERRGFTLDDVSNVTKINARMLRAIEDEHFDLLPGGVFNKGFVRAYAKHLGFNDEESVTEYLAALRQAQVQAETAGWQHAVLPPQLPGRPSRGEKIPVEQGGVMQLEAEKALVASKPSLPAVPVASKVAAEVAHHKPAVKPEVKAEFQPEPPPAPKTREIREKPQPYSSAQLDLPRVAPREDSIPWKIPAVVLAVVLVAGVLWNRHSRGVQAEGAASAHATDSRVAPASSSALPAAKLSANSSLTSSPQVAANRGPGNSSALAAGHERDAASATPDHVTTEQRATDVMGSAARRLPGSAAATKAPPVFTLRIRASETSWISVSADGQPVIQETLIAPAGTSIRATREITVRVGNAAGISFLLNGKEIPPQGSEAEVKTLIFDGQGIKEGAHTPTADGAR